MTTTITEKLREVEDAFFDIPFENSQFQNEAFVVAAQITPARAYRAIGLRLTAKLRALNEAVFAKKKLDIDIAELDEKIANPDTPKFDRMRAEVDREQKLSTEWMTRKLIRDAEVECSTLYAIFNQMPRFTREQFEAEEGIHFRERLLRQANDISGAAESLTNMDVDCVALANGGFGTENLEVTKKICPQLINWESKDGK